jgi:hypothetical protein
MKKDQFKGNVGKRVLLFPSAVGTATDGRADEWLVTKADEHVELTNLRTNHCAVVGFDAIYSFTSDPSRESGDGVRCGLLQMLVQLDIGDDRHVKIEPLPFARGGGTDAAANGVNLLRLDLRKAVAEAHLQIEDMLDLIRKCLQSRHGVISASQLGIGAMRGARAKHEADMKEIGQMKRELPNETKDFSAMSAAELETQLVRVHSIQTRTGHWRERYARELALDDQRRQERRAHADAQLNSLRRQGR